MAKAASTMDPLVTTTALLSLAVWLYLFLLRGGFWRADRRLGEEGESLGQSLGEWPAVIALVPARDEQDVIAAALRALLSQDYPGPLKIVVIDDNSRDATAAAARAAATGLRTEDRLILVRAQPPLPGWAGKTWALNEGQTKSGAAPWMPPMSGSPMPISRTGPRPCGVWSPRRNGSGSIWSP